MKIYKIKKTSGLTTQQVYNNLTMGGHLVIYGYCISIIALTFRLISSPYLIKPGEKLSKYRGGFTFTSLLFGWWGLPNGPVYTIDMLRINAKQGGIDVTEDLLPMINEQYADADKNQVLENDLTVIFNDDELLVTGKNHNY